MHTQIKTIASSLKTLMFLSLVSLLSFACGDLDEDFIECNENGPHFFEPANKTFIPPVLGSFIDTINFSLELEEDRSFFDLTSSKVCLLEQHLTLVVDSLDADFCDGIITFADLDTYYYQYLGLRMGKQDYIFVNAFKADLVETFDWTNEPFIGKGKNGTKHWSVLFNLDELIFEQYQSNLIKEIFHLPELPEFQRCISMQNLKTFPLENKDICSLNDQMIKLQEILSTGCYSPGYSVDLSEGWLFQYLGVQKSESRWIYINAISTLFYPDVKDNGFLQNFHSKIQLISDAGRGSWGVLFNLDNHDFVDLQFNDSR